MRVRAVLALLGTGILLAVIGWFWAGSFAPDDLSAADMGDVDGGGGTVRAERDRSGSTGMTGGGDHHDHHGGNGRDAGGHNAGGVVSVDRLVARSGPADRHFVLRAQQAGPHRYLINGRTPGPVLRVRQGDLVEVKLINESVPNGVTLHWHGVDVPNAADGVAGVTQDAVKIGQEYVYRFVADRAGTFWYHSHQLSHEQVLGGLLGALVVEPRRSTAESDAVALIHLYQGKRTVNGSAARLKINIRDGQRLRVINTDNGPVTLQVAGAGYRVLATDGSDVVGPTEVRDREVTVTAGGRVDLGLDAIPATVEISGVGWVDVNGGAPTTAGTQPELDLLRYGRHVPVDLQTATPDRTFRYDLGRRPGFVRGKPGLWWTINGKMWPKVPMFMVSEGDVVRMTITNHSGDVHPMHLHGHRVLILSRNGEPSTGSPWWLDSINVRDGDTYVIAFRADNPGIWMDHCHNLPHAAQGLIAHLMYQGVTTPYRLNDTNEPE
ncbi:multicopper oxidase family protein [Microlunatus elymi]|uniref:Multicopper oxidase family protein n=1 Tax=Microlunatus elymi TaxID=2596828 RepID=A0A516PUP1_9ACTN|nr:multicopper oxidase family protein [Microlunatus elymi]QDP94908.1 multicopper oxidase family protein [Microlunatus elymi]